MSNGLTEALTSNSSASLVSQEAKDILYNLSSGDPNLSKLLIFNQNSKGCLTFNSDLTLEIIIYNLSKTMLSKSLYIPSNGSLGKSKKGVALPEIKNMAIELSKISAIDVNINLDLKIKYHMNQEFAEFKEYIKAIDFKNATSPFLRNSFHLKRSEAFHKLQKLIKDLPFQQKQIHLHEFVKRIDVELLDSFRYHLKEPYIHLVFEKYYNIPKSIEKEQIKETQVYDQFWGLSNIIAMWTIEMEMASDLIDRAVLYGLYKADNEKEDVIQKLKAKSNADNKLSATGSTGKIFKVVLLKFIRKLSSILSTKGFNFTSISWSACVAIFYYIVGAAAIPWGGFTLAGAINIPWICGGLLGSKILDKVGTSIQRKDLIKDIEFLSEIIISNTEELRSCYRDIAESIDRCFDPEFDDEKGLEFCKKALKHRINSMTSSSASKNANSLDQSLTKSRLDLTVIVEHDDYVEVDLEEEKIQEGKKGEKENKKTEEIQSSKKKTVVDDSEDIPL